MSRLWERTAAAVMAAAVATTPIDEAARIAVDAADALSREMDRRDRERDEAQQRLSADFDRAWEALYEQFGDAWRDHDAQRRARENVWRIFHELGGDPNATIEAVNRLAEAKEAVTR